MKSSNPPATGAWIEISRGALRNNLGAFRRVLPDQVRLGVVLKGDAYGHGLLPTLACVHGLVDVVYVIEPSDALAVRAWELRNGRPPVDVLVIGVLGPEDVVALARADVSVVWGDESWDRIIAALAEADAPAARAHVHIDSGLGREGFSPDELQRALAPLATAGAAVDVVGVLTHFADVEDVTEHTYARRQLSVFQRGVEGLTEVLRQHGRPPPAEVHAAASAAAMVLPESRLGAVRIGIALYGLWPSRETRISTRLVSDTVTALQPALAWRCRVQAVRTLSAGSFVGYGCTFRCAADTRTAVLPVGYYDGYPRLASGRGHVLVNGVRCPLLGRVMMNHLVVDVSDVASVEVGDVATLIGRDGDEVVHAGDVAEWAQTIHYEIVTRLRADLPRLLVG